MKICRFSAYSPCTSTSCWIGRHVIKDISLRIRPGEYIALVGPSGAGKTTLCSLIPRFYDVTDGELLLDGMYAHLYAKQAAVG